MLSKNAEEKMNVESVLQGDMHAVVIIRSMYPSKSRTEISREFQQLYSIGFKAGYQIAQDESKAENEKLRECLVKAAKIIHDSTAYMGHTEDCPAITIDEDDPDYVCDCTLDSFILKTIDIRFEIEALQKDEEVRE